MNVLIIGSGGREHALALKISESKNCDQIYVSPGNGGTTSIAKNVILNLSEIDKITEFCNINSIDFVIVGPEQPLVDGLADHLRAKGIIVFGPNKKAAMIEGNKRFAKELMREFNIPTASFNSFSKNQYDEIINYLRNGKFPIVIKASGLAAGKGVIIAQTPEEAEQAITEMIKESKFGSASDEIVIEEFLEGEELSIFAITDGEDYVLLPASQDHKRIGEGDTGKNTGGMGAYAPLTFVNSEMIKEIEDFVVKPTLNGLLKKNSKFIGCLYCGLINTKEGIKVIEFNCRFGDPETQVVLPLLEGDFLELLYSTAKGKINKESIKYNGGSAIGVVTVAGGYPDKYEKGNEISGLETINSENINIIHAGTVIKDGKLYTNGGRVLNIISYSKQNDLINNKTLVYTELDKVKYKDIYYRKDIAYKQFNK